MEEAITAPTRGRCKAVDPFDVVAGDGDEVEGVSRRRREEVAEKETRPDPFAADS